MKFASILVAISVAALAAAAPASAAEVPTRRVPAEPNEGAGVSAFVRRHFNIIHDYLDDLPGDVKGCDKLNEAE